MNIVLSCEHAVNTIPSAFQSVFAPHIDLLKTHRGYDIGAQSIAQKFAKTLQVPYVEANVSRLLIDFNRTTTHPHCFSFISKTLSPAERQTLIDDYYNPYRAKVLAHLEKTIQQHGQVLHVSVHSFTPVFKNTVRHGDLCLLYDPARTHEKPLAEQWISQLKQQAPQYHYRRNYPYLGKSDGFVSSCRKRFSPEQYIGFEIEFNQSTLSHPSDKLALENAMLRVLQQV